MRHRGTFERLKTNLGETRKRILVIIMRKMTMRTLQQVQAIVFHPQHILHGLVGRPSFTISVEQIQALRKGVFFRWTDIARILGVSTRTLSRSLANEWFSRVNTRLTLIG